MKIGIVSDSHGRSARLASALKALIAGGAETIVHCGDVGSVECVELLGSTGAAAYMIPGNMDRHPERLEEAARRCGVNFAWEVITVPIGENKYLAAAHGHDGGVLDKLIAAGQFPYVCHGHTHSRRDTRIGDVRVINPGALHNARRYTAALLDTDAATLEYIEIPR